MKRDQDDEQNCFVKYLNVYLARSIMKKYFYTTELIFKLRMAKIATAKILSNGKKENII